MSSEEEIEKSVGNDPDTLRESEKSSTITYSRDFLISFRELDICKTLPSGFDSSLLSEFEDGYHGTQDRQRIPGSFPLQSHRRTDYSSSPPTRGDSSNYSRGGYGRWDSRSSVRSERDSDSQSDKDSDSGRSQGNQTRKTWQSGEHDGLLGSGSFARPPGYAPPGLSGPRGRPNDQYQLKKSNEPYHPPRPYKAGPLSRREMTDSLNDETFGSAEGGSQDRVEEERRRRETFELMRKEQHKSLQENQNLTDKLKKDQFSELVGEADVENKASVQTSVVRPLVPPGFKTTVTEKNPSSTSLPHSRALEVGKPDIKDSISHGKTMAHNGILDNEVERHKQNFSTNTEIFNGEHGADTKLYRNSSLSLESETQGIGEIKKMAGHNFIDTSSQAQQPSILDKLFNSVISDNVSGSSGLVEKQDTKQDDLWNPPIQASKFAQWFSEDDKKGTEDLSHTRPNDLFSLFGGNEKGGSQVFNAKPESTDGHFISGIIPSTVEFPKNLYKPSKVETSLPVLTCEDLEQTILSGYTENNSTSEKNIQGQNIFNLEEPKAETDSGASQHLLSLLKGPVLNDMILTPNSETGFSEKKVEKVSESGNSLTLETLFGSAFMKELKSAEAPVSALGSSVKSNINGQSGNLASWFGNSDTQIGSDSSKQRSDLSSKRGGSDGGIDIHLPEEENLIGINDPVFNPFGNLINRESQSSNKSFDMSDKLAGLNTGFNDERTSMRGPYGPIDREIPFSSSPGFNPGPQMRTRPPFHPLDTYPTHANPLMNFNAQEGMTQHGGPMNHMMRPPFRHPSGGQAGYDVPHHMLQQMHMQRPLSNNNSFPRNLQEFDRDGPVPLHLRTRGGGSIPEHSHMPGFPFELQQANYGGPGVPMQAPVEVRGNHPEAFQRLLEMELRANNSSKQRVIHPFDSFANNQGGLHGHDIDSSFRYR